MAYVREREMKIHVLLLLMLVLLGCGSREALSDSDIDRCIRSVAYVPFERFYLVPGCDENLVKKSQREGLFSAGVGKREGNYWLWIIRSKGANVGLESDIYQLVKASPKYENSRIRLSQDGRLSLEDGSLCENWWEIDFGYQIQLDAERKVMNQGRHSSHKTKQNWSNGSSLDVVNVQRVSLNYVFPLCMRFFSGVKSYSLALYKKNDRIYLLEEWSDRSGDWYCVYKYSKNIGMYGGYEVDGSVRLVDNELYVGFSRRAKHWISILDWKSPAGDARTAGQGA